jgi:TonB family protein
MPSQNRLTMYRPLLVLALLAPAVVAAQATDSTATCANVFAGAETEIDSLILSAAPGYRLELDHGAGMQAFTMSVATALQLPQPLAVPGVVNTIYPSVPEWKPRTSKLPGGFMGEAMLRLGRDGKAKDVRLVQTTLEPTIDAALVAAVKSTADLGLPPEIVAAAKHAGGGALFVRLETRVGWVHASARGPDTNRVSVPVAALRVPLIDITAQPKRTKGSNPQYPDVALANGFDGRVMLLFVIGADGKVVPGTVNLFGQAEREFAQASIDATTRSEFAPAMAGKCPVPVLVMQPFTFKIR